MALRTLAGDPRFRVILVLTLFSARLFSSLWFPFLMCLRLSAAGSPADCVPQCNLPTPNIGNWHYTLVNVVQRDPHPPPSWPHGSPYPTQTGSTCPPRSQWEGRPPCSAPERTRTSRFLATAAPAVFAVTREDRTHFTSSSYHRDP